MKYCNENGIPVPKFYKVNSIDSFIQKSQKLGFPEEPICFKPPISNGLRGFRIIQQDPDKMDSLINEKPNNVVIGYEEFLNIAERSSYFPELLLMEYLPGQEYSVDVMVDKGKYHQAIPRTRDKIKMGISFVGTVVQEEAVINYSKEIVQSLELNGNIGLQFKVSKDGVPKIIECNPRVQGTIVLCTAAGYNMIHNNIRSALGEKPINFEIQWGTKMVRYWEEIFFNEQGAFKLDD